MGSTAWKRCCRYEGGIFGAKLSFASENFDRAMKYWLKIVTLPRLVELGATDKILSLVRTWLDADNSWVTISSNHENKCWWSCMSWECRDAEDWVRPEREISCSQSQVYVWSYLSGQENPKEKKKNTTVPISGQGLKQLTNNTGAICYWCLWLGSTRKNEDVGCAHCLIRKYYSFSSPRTF